MKKEDFKRCKFAGDEEDEYCCGCDGYFPIDDNGVAQPATDCGGYEPAEEEPENEPEQKQEQATPETPDSQNESWGDSQFATPPNKNNVKGITSVIRAESGVSCELNGTWYKFMYSEERIVPEGCDIEAEKQALWDSVNAEVDAQVEAVRN